MKLEQIHIFVAGIVQGVGFRYHTRAEALRLGLSGWVRNTRDSRVEILAEGDGAAIAAFLQWCGRGPSAAHVTGVEVTARKPIGAATSAGFEIRH
jgi:acylphosphatase